MSDALVVLNFEGPIATVTINRPRVLNALNQQTVRELGQALAEVAVKPDCRALIVTGAGEKAFVAGADIGEMANHTEREALENAQKGQHILAQLEALKIPTLAAVNGFALGGGCELALACDLIYASEKAKFGLPEVSLGVIPGFGGTQRLTRLVGRARAKELIFTGDMIDAAKAKEYGLVLEVVAPDQLIPHCKEVIGRMLKKGPLAIGAAKRVIDAGFDDTLAGGCRLEAEAFASLFNSADQKEGMAAFTAKRPANFTAA